MPKLFVYDAQEVHKKHYPSEDPVMLGFTKALKTINPQIPFLRRTLLGDSEFIPEGSNTFLEKNTIENTFQGRDIYSLLYSVLQNGHDKDNLNFSRLHPYERELIKKIEGLKQGDMLWACQCDSTESTGPYRFNDDIGFSPQGFVHDFSLIINPLFYESADKNKILFFQPEVEKRKKALLGIIISNTKPTKDDCKRPSLEFDLTLQNLNEVIEEIKRNNYFK